MAGCNKPRPACEPVGRLMAGIVNAGRLEYTACRLSKIPYFSPVDTIEIKKRIDQMSDDERFFAAAYLQHLAQERDPAYRAMLSQRMKRMDAGEKVKIGRAHV